MLFGGPAEQRCSDAPVVSLLALALADGIVGQNDEPLKREIACDHLHGRFAIFPVTERQKHCGKTSRLIRPIQVRGYEKPRQAFEQNFVDYESRLIDVSRDDGMQRTGII